ncbi:MAG: hypothetical protein JSW63_07275 [Ignavibacterium sp.]|nr:MAG: hypothetical protein JSW63_07275 [Ignavibacterium sp.]
MKKKLTVFVGLTFLIILFFTFQSSISKPHINNNENSHFSEIDTFDFDTEEFKKEMEELREELKSLKKEKIKIEFDAEKFREDMEELAVEMENLRKKDFKFHFDSEQFKEDMKELSMKLKDKKIVIKDFDFDMSEFKEQMKELKKELKDIKIELRDIDDLSLLGKFMKELKLEMKNDGLIEDENEEINLKLNKDEIILNGERVPDELFQKYIELYKDHFNKELGDEFSIHIYK